MSDKTHVVWHAHQVTPQQRVEARGHRGCVVWFTGLSGSGKSTLANSVDQQLFADGIQSYVLDGDNVRHGLNASPELLRTGYGDEFADRFGLTFAAVDRQENIRRTGAVAELFAAAGLVALTAFISPYRRDRDAVRHLVDPDGAGRFIEVFVDAPLEVCESRDPKGLYKRARAGEIRDFTGISAPYEPPESPELRLDATAAIQENTRQLVDYLKSQGVIGKC